MAGLPKFSVSRPVTAMMVALIVVGFGLFGLTKLRLNLYPDVSFPTITVYTVYEGVAPGDMETLVTRPIEEQVGSVSGVLKMRSLSSQGASVVKLYFDWSTNLFEAQIEVRKQLDLIRNGLPRDVEQPIVFNYDPNQEPVVVLALKSNSISTRELRTFATQRLEPLIERVPGVASSATVGGLDRQITVRARPAALQQYGITLGELAGTIRSENVQVPAGEMIEGSLIFSLRALGEFKTVEQIKNTVVAVREGNPIRLSDVTEVLDDVAQPVGGVRIDGEQGLIVNIYKQSDANIVGVAESIISSLEGMKKILPKGAKIDVLTNQADFIQQSISNLYLTAFQAVILVILILLFFLQSWRAALIIAISIPISIIATFAAMDWASMSLNVISLSGLTLAIGMVVDDAVVVLENIFQMKNSGKRSSESAIDGAREVAVPVVISTVTTLVVFLPILFVPGIAGVLFRDLALTVSFALSISSLVALSIIPLLSSKILGKQEDSNELVLEKSKFGKILASAGRALLTPFRAIGRPLGRQFDKLGSYLEKKLDAFEQRYESILESILPKSGRVIFGAFILFVATTPLFFQLSRDFFPPVDESRFTLEVLREPGINVFELERTVAMVEEVLEDKIPEARLIVSEFGDKPGVEGADNPGGNYAAVRVELVSRQERSRSQFAIVADALESLRDIPGADIKEVRKNPLSPDGENGLILYLFGYDQEKKAEIATQTKTLLSEKPEFVNVSSSSDKGRPELRVMMNRERISRLGLSTTQVANAISDAVRGNLATSFVDQGLSFDVIVEIDPAFKNSQQALENLQISLGDRWVPLKLLADIQRVTGPDNILRINQERVSEIQIDLGNVDLNSASVLSQEVVGNISLPDGYRFEVSGTAEEQARSFWYLIIAFSIASILTYMVMAAQFESFTEPFIMLVTIPLALSGVIFVLYVTNTPISVTSMIGLVLLSGIVVNNGIVMIDYIKILQLRGYDRKAAVIQGAARRLRPILMTAGTTILSMVPLALELGTGSETWSPMARTVIGGLSASTLLMLFVVPCMYFVLNGMLEKLGFTRIRKLDPLAHEN